MPRAKPKRVRRPPAPGFAEEERPFLHDDIMLNPAHPRMRDVAIVASRRFHFDARLSAPPRRR
jgi:hypothetical protein